MAIAFKNTKGDINKTIPKAIVEKIYKSNQDLTFRMTKNQLQFELPLKHKELK